MFSNVAGALPAAWDVIQEGHCRRIEGRVIIEQTKKGASTCDGLVAAITGRLRCDLRAGCPLRIVERPCTPMMP
jgi:hypothetical protein